MTNTNPSRSHPASIALSLLALLALLFPTNRASAEDPAPKSPDGSVEATLFASEPDIVTPIGATVDSKGRLLVIESNSHFRPKDYKGPPVDRIRIMEDTTGSGKADKITSFFEGMKFLMNLVTDRDGSIVVSSRNEIFRLVPDEKGVAGPKITLATLETKADYPHNGLHGLAVDPDGNIYFGIGENLGGPYTLVGSDGQKFSDTDKNAGTIFKMDSKGGGLTRVATGFWNPFALGFGPNNILFAADNDPDGRPPCRLMPVAPGGDYGYQYRYGRTGMHPLQAYDGELPGTLPMITGVGEAPCAVRWLRNQLLVTSWRDHRIEAYSLTPKGGTFTATMKPILTGGDNFRPVAIAPAPDGSFFVTDWVSSSYTLHGKGRVWKVKYTKPAVAEEAFKPSAAMERIGELRKSTKVQDLLDAMDDADINVSQAAQFGLSRLPESEKLELADLASPSKRVGLLTALIWRGANAQRHLAAALNDPDVRVREMGVRVVTEQEIKEARPDLEKMLASPVMSPQLLSMVVAAIAQLDGEPSKNVNSAKVNGMLLARLKAADTADTTKTLALRMLQADALKLDEVRPLLASSAKPLALEAVRYLSVCIDPKRLAILADIAADEKNDTSMRADALVGLAEDPTAYADLLLKLSAGDNASLRQEALRTLRPAAAKLTDAQKKELEKSVAKNPTDADLVNRLLGKAVPARPEEADMAGWKKLLEQNPGDPEAGRRIFFQPAAAGCYHCHMIQGRGKAVGPDLTMIGNSRTREHVLESILDPSKEIAPLYMPWTLTLKNGTELDAMLLSRVGNTETFVDNTQKEYKLQSGDITDRVIRKVSIMPAGLVQSLTDQELRDLIAMLMQKR